MKLYAELTKTEKQPDGTLHVFGYASTGTTDDAGEIVTADAMKAALPDYMKFGNVREMHQLSAVGTALEASVGDDGRTFFGAHIVDPTAVKKVETGVYKGFSIGGKVTGRDELKKTTVTGIRLSEISLVDRPCNPEAVITLFKIDNPEAAVDDLAKLLDSGSISPARLLELAEADAVAKASATTGDPAAQADEAAKAAVSETNPAEKPVNETELKKGMYSLQTFASLLASLGCLASDAEWEAQYEGDASKLPAQLREWLAAGVVIFKAMSDEETSELLASLAPPTPVVVVDVLELAAKTDDLQKVLTEANDAVTKVRGEHDTVLKALGAKEGDVLVDLVKALVVDREDLAKRLTTLQAMPAPGKALLKAIGKGGDAVELEAAKPIEKVTNFSGNESDVATLIKAVHRQGSASFNS